MSVENKLLCLVKIQHYIRTNKHLDCSKCPCDCIHSGKHKDTELLPTKRPENQGRKEI